jgi:hypothetical protein
MIAKVWRVMDGCTKIEKWRSPSDIAKRVPAEKAEW